MYDSIVAALNAAMNQEDTKVLQNAISQAQSIKHKGKLSSEISDAQRLLEVRFAVQNQLEMCGYGRK